MRKLIAGAAIAVSLAGIVGCGQATKDSSDKPAMSKDDKFVSAAYNNVDWIGQFNFSDSEIIDMAHNVCEGVGSYGAEGYINQLAETMVTDNIQIDPVEVGEFVGLSINYYCPEFDPSGEAI